MRALAAEPRPTGCRKLIGAQNRWRIRIGDHRTIYAVNDSSRVVKVIAVRHRSKAYE
ncbi:MAG: type II toxin-antitoxin system RelE/ParE family toxin [Pyrinomonadaceae bacterium]|nr:type II toxin-antitoxin system RelE/ParE family toxin [Pyrinomonadaceae bacterium]